MLLAFGVAAAVADPVQQFDVQIKNVTADGHFSVVFTSNSFDTTGAPPPGLTEASVSFAKGITIKPEFLKRDRLCQTGKLRLILLASQTKTLKYKAMLGGPRGDAEADRRQAPARRACGSSTPAARRSSAAATSSSTRARTSPT